MAEAKVKAAFPELGIAFEAASHEPGATGGAGRPAVFSDDASAARVEAEPAAAGSGRNEPNGAGSTLARCLESLEVDSSSAFAACGNIVDEFKVVKKAYFKRVLATHPDKGGDAAEFRAAQRFFKNPRRDRGTRPRRPRRGGAANR